MSDVVEEVNDWLATNWDPDLTVAEWWERLGLSGWAAPTYPVEAYGKGLSRGDAVLVGNAIAAHGALSAPGGLGLLLAGPTIAKHGTKEQIETYVRDIVTGQKAWCQLFSEPGAGSDLAGLQARAEQDGEEWIVNGQKVWTSGGHIADLGMLIARTDSSLPKHQGITYFAIDMHQPGMDVRPLREMTGRALFNEVFLTDAVARDDAMIGGKNNGWAVANSTLAFERAGLGAGGGSQSTSVATPGTVGGHLDKRAGDFVNEAPKPKAKPKPSDDSSSDSKPKPRQGGSAALGGLAGRLRQLAEANGSIANATIRNDLMRLHSMTEIGRINNLRVKGARAMGKEIPGMANISKLSMSNLVRLQRDLSLRIVGASGMLHAYDADKKDAITEATGNPFLGVITELALFAQAPPIYGGTDQVQRNIIGERVLGLPKEPNNDRVTPFSELPKNA
jgi:alkylation response protein AidB-like acyl-CoA dehydrogenase